MKPKVYLETTIPSYLTARPSRDLIRAANQLVTREWWDLRRGVFDLYISQIVLEEAAAGDPAAAALRLELIGGVTVLKLSPEAFVLAEELTRAIPLPPKAAVDALHIAIGVVNGINYILTWNCRHIANAVHRSRIEAICRSSGWDAPVICTPDVLLGDDYDDFR